MEKFVARQPIFNRQLRVYGYELLFRSGIESLFCGESSERASAGVIVDSSLVIGLQELTGNRKAFINCTSETLTKDHVLLIPHELAVLEILETVEPDEGVLAACRKLKQSGYLLALDDFVPTEKIKPLADLVDIIKVDFRTTERDERGNLVRRFASQGLMLLAEKLETREEFREALDLGYSLFQGYFFGRPETISGRDIPIFKLNYLELLRQIHSAEPELKVLEDTVKHDAALCYKLLRYLNSPYFGFRGEIHTIRHAFTLLGFSSLKKWLSAVVLASIATDEPEELVISSLIRANFGEALAPTVGLKGRDEDLYFMGLLSMMDAILGRSMAEVVGDIAISEEIKKALLDGRNRFRDVFDLIVSYERGDWEQFERKAIELKVDEPKIPPIYFESLQRAESFFHI